MREFVKDHSDHEVVHLHRSLLELGFVYHVPVKIMLHCSNDTCLDK